MTENNSENQAQYCAQYYDQVVLKREGCSYTLFMPSTYIKEVIRKEAKDQLELKPLRYLSDEDALEIAQIAETIETLGIKEDCRIQYVNNNLYFLIEKRQVYQYLLSKGYLLPWRDLTIDQILEYGWAIEQLKQ